MTYGCGKSDSAAESVERRVEAKGNTGQQSTYRAQPGKRVTGAE